eukprot:5546448-Pyramimonas_sp.AAC.1
MLGCLDVHSIADRALLLDEAICPPAWWSVHMWYRPEPEGLSTSIWTVKVLTECWSDGGAGAGKAGQASASQPPSPSGGRGRAPALLHPMVETR